MSNVLRPRKIQAKRNNPIRTFCIVLRSILFGELIFK